MRIAVTGARGFVGRHLVTLLEREGHIPIGVGRDASSSQAPFEMRTVPSYTDAVALSEVLRDVDAVVHLAARVHVMRETSPDPDADFLLANLESTRSIASALSTRGGGRLVLTSTVKVHGEGGGDPVSAQSPFAPSDPYARSKVAAEQFLRSEAPEGVTWSVVRPPLVYGPSVGGNFRRLLSLSKLSMRVPLPLGGIKNARSMVYVENLASLLSCCAVDPRAAGQAFIASDSRALSTTELIERLAAELGGRARLFHLPEAVIRVGGRLVGRSAEVDRLLDSFRIDASSSNGILQWAPPVSVEDGLQRTAAWWVAQ